MDNAHTNVLVEEENDYIGVIVSCKLSEGGKPGIYGWEVKEEDANTLAESGKDHQRHKFLSLFGAGNSYKFPHF